MAERFENLGDILPDWVNEDEEKSLAEAVDKFQKQEDEKNTFIRSATGPWAPMDRSRNG